jgi:drug/metabolite transporter superfamily protein YnfA
MNVAARTALNSFGVVMVLACAAFLEAFADSFFQISLHRAAGTSRVLAFLAGVAVMVAYGSLVNVPRWDFGRLIGAYVALFFLLAQVLNRVRFGQQPTAPIYTGGALIVAGALVIALWRG